MDSWVDRLGTRGGGRSERQKGPPCPCNIWSLHAGILGDPLARLQRVLIAHRVPPTFSSNEPEGQSWKDLAQSNVASQGHHGKQFGSQRAVTAPPPQSSVRRQLPGDWCCWDPRATLQGM